MWNGAERVGDTVDREKLYSVMLLKSGFRKEEGEKSKEEEAEDMSDAQSSFSVKKKRRFRSCLGWRPEHFPRKRLWGDMAAPCTNQQCMLPETCPKRERQEVCVRVDVGGGASSSV